MHILDMKTVITGFFISNALCAAVQFMVWRRHRGRYAGVGRWLICYLLGSAGILLISLRGIVPDLLSIVAGNLCLVGGTWILLDGLERFLDRRGPQFLNLLMIAAVAFGLTRFTRSRPDLTARTLVIFGALTVLAVQGAWLMLRRVPKPSRPLTRLTGCLFLALAAANAYRVAIAIALPPPETFFKIQTLHTLGVLLDQTIEIAMAFALVLMIDRRLLEDVRRAEHSLAGSEAILRETGRIASVGGWEFDPATMKTIWTEETTRIHDLDPTTENAVEAGIGFYRAESREKIKTAVREAIDHGMSFDLELELVTAGGNRKWVRTIGHPVVLDGRVVRVRGSIQDITDRKRADEHIHNLSRFPDENPNPVMRIGRDGKLMYANEASKPVLESWNILTGQSVPVDIQTWIEEAFLSNQGREADIRCGPSIFSCSLAPIIGEGYANLYARDVTELRETEARVARTTERLDLATRAAGVGVWDWDIRNDILAWDERMIGLYGIRKEDFTGAYAAWLNGIHPDDRAEQDEISRRAREGAREYDTEFRVVWPDGSIHHLIAHGIFVRDAGGTPLRMTGVNLDVTDRRRSEAETLRLLDQAEKTRRALLSILEDRKQAEEEVRRLNTELEQRVRDRTVRLEAANKELEAFSYSVSHDLRSPLRGIDGWSLALVEDHGGRLDGAALGHLNRIRSEVQRMGRLIDDMLHLSRVTRADLAPQIVDLTALARRIADSLEEENPGRAVAFETEPGLNAKGDPALLDILLTNLLANSWKFTAGREEARIAFGRAPNGFFVRDNGAGFEAARADGLFSPFRRFHKQSEFQGSGIGLAIVQRIAARHGGRVWAESEPDKGAAFYFTLGEET
jgi:PAS domain S-box-containing protein